MEGERRLFILRTKPMNEVEALTLNSNSWIVLVSVWRLTLTLEDVKVITLDCFGKFEHFCDRLRWPLLLPSHYETNSFNRTKTNIKTSHGMKVETFWVAKSSKFPEIGDKTVDRKFHVAHFETFITFLITYCKITKWEITNYDSWGLQGLIMIILHFSRYLVCNETKS